MSTINAAKRLPLFALFLILLFTSSITLAADKSDDDPGYLGVLLQDLQPSMVKALQMDDKSGVLISEIVEDSPAESAGLEDGDVILVFNGRETENSKDLTRAVRKANAGDKVEVVVLRGGKKKTIKVVLGKREDDAFGLHMDKFKQLHKRKDLDKLDSFTWSDDDDGHIRIITKGDHGDIHMDQDFAFFGSDRGFLGVQMDDLNEQLGEFFGIEDGEGVLVTEVVEDSPAEEAGLKAGDVIVGIGGEKVASSEELLEEMAGTEADQKLKVEVRRKGKKKEFEVTLGEGKANKMIKRIELLGDGAHFNVLSPKMKRHMAPNVEFRKQHHGNDLEEMRDELKMMKKELKKIQEELKK